MAARGVKVRANESADTWTQVCLGLGDLQTARTEAARAVEETNKLQAKTLQTLAKGTGREFLDPIENGSRGRSALSWILRTDH